MPKRKSTLCPGLDRPPPSLSSLDAAFDLLACDTFTRLDTLVHQFEKAVGLQLDKAVVQGRWAEAVKRYYVMKDIDGLCCSQSMGSSRRNSVGEADKGVVMRERRDQSMDDGRPLPSAPHPGPAAAFGLTEEEEQEWRCWHPKLGDVVLAHLADGTMWPAKVIDKRYFFQGRTTPRGNHFFPIRVYNESIAPTITIRSRLIPFHMRSSPPLLANEAVQSAYHHAANPCIFDEKASTREIQAAYGRMHPGVGCDDDLEVIKRDKEEWNKVVNWVMNERRVEKLRALTEERDKRLREAAKPDDGALTGEGGGDNVRVDGKPREVEMQNLAPKKRRTSSNIPLPPADSPNLEDKSDGLIAPRPTTIFGPHANMPCSTPRRTSSPSLASFIRPALVTPTRTLSPRRLDKKGKLVYTGVGEWSPRARGRTYTPPRILPSGDETAPAASSATASPLLSRHFDFVSPLGPVKFGRLSNGGHGVMDDDRPSLPRSESLGDTRVTGQMLSVVQEDPKEEDGEGWTVVSSRRGRAGRAESAPCEEREESKLGLSTMTVVVGSGEESMDI